MGDERRTNPFPQFFSNPLPFPDREDTHKKIQKKHAFIKVKAKLTREGLRRMHQPVAKQKHLVRMEIPIALLFC